MSKNWLSVLRNEINKARRICVLGIGNTQRADDATGPLATIMIMSRMRSQKFKNLIFVNGGETPENFTGAIRNFCPTLTLIVDSCISGKKPGTVSIIDTEKIQENDISTHNMPLSMLVKFLSETIPTKVIVIGIEPKSLDFGGNISPEVNKAIDLFVSKMSVILNDWEQKQRIPSQK